MSRFSDCTVYTHLGVWPRAPLIYTSHLTEIVTKWHGLGGHAPQKPEPHQCSFGRLASEAETHRKRFIAQPCLDIARSTSVDHEHDRRWQDAIDSLREVMATNRAKLSEIERQIIIERFSTVSGGKGRTYEEIGNIIGLTSERIRQMHKLALRKIRAAFEHEQFGRPRRLVRQAG